MAAGSGTPYVSLFGSSYPTSTGPARSKGLGILLETPNRYTCEKACYKYQCSVDNDYPCINEISPKYHVVPAVLDICGVSQDKMTKYKEHKDHLKNGGSSHSQRQ